MEHPAKVLPPDGMTPVILVSDAIPTPIEPPAPPLSAAPAVSKKVVSMPSDQIAKIRKEEREKGERRARDEMDRRVKAAGFDSIEAMELAAKRKISHQRPVARPAKQVDQLAASAQTSVPAVSAKKEREIQRLEQERQAARRQAVIADKKRREAVKELDKHRAETALRESAIQAGVVDTGYALHLLREHLGSLTPKEMQTFDETAYFSGLKGSKPHLFAVHQQPANTTPSPARPQVQTAIVPTPAPSVGLDANKLTTDQYHEVLKRRGIRIPGLTP